MDQESREIEVLLDHGNASDHEDGVRSDPSIVSFFCYLAIALSVVAGIVLLVRGTSGYDTNWPFVCGGVASIVFGTAFWLACREACVALIAIHQVLETSQRRSSSEEALASNRDA